MRAGFTRFSFTNGSQRLTETDLKPVSDSTMDQALRLYFSNGNENDYYSLYDNGNQNDGDY